MTDNKRSEDSEHRGMDGLTEVLRLQAEALSRISERMAGMRGGQPESAPIQPPPLCTRDSDANQAVFLSLPGILF